MEEDKNRGHANIMGQYSIWWFLNLHLSLVFPQSRQVDKDCDFLEQERIMDYSLLVGLHFQETSHREASTPESHHSGFCCPFDYFLSNLSFLFQIIVSAKSIWYLKMYILGSRDPDYEADGQLGADKEHDSAR